MASLEALAEHFRQPHMAAFREALSRHPPASVTASFFEAQEISAPQV
jgi:quinol monooxygenase YgiN